VLDGDGCKGTGPEFVCPSLNSVLVCAAVFICFFMWLSLSSLVVILLSSLWPTVVGGRFSY
jgi:hypothetical protein